MHKSRTIRTISVFPGGDIMITKGFSVMACREVGRLRRAGLALAWHGPRFRRCGTPAPPGSGAAGPDFGRGSDYRYWKAAAWPLWRFAFEGEPGLSGGSGGGVARNFTT